MNDYMPITVERETAGVLLGTWWRQPPYVICKDTYAPYQGEGVRPVTVKTEVLASTGKRTERYEPIEEAELLNALLDVAQGKLKPVEFANRFGLLGYNYVVPNAHRCKAGDPLDWFLGQARTVQTIAEIIRCLKKTRDSGQRHHIAKYLTGEISDGPYALGGKVVRIRFQQSPTSPVLTANGILRYLFDANLGGARRRLQSTKHGLRTVFTFRALIEVIYWQLADQLGQSSIHRCIECGRIFTHSNTRTRFCPATAGKKISPCKSRWNVRQFRKRQRRRKR